MLFVRLIHAAYSLLIVVFGYKIAEVLSDRETAKETGLVLALFWAFDAFCSIAWFDIVAKAIPSNRRGRLFNAGQMLSG